MPVKSRAVPVDGAGEKELAVLRELSARPEIAASQRQIARNARVSLGMTNLILKTLARKGYVKIKKLNQKKVRYILTPRGAAEKTRKAYRAVWKTLATVRSMKAAVLAAVAGRGPGVEGRGLAIAGEGELADVAELALREAGFSWRRVKSAADARPQETPLLCSRKAAREFRSVPGREAIDLVGELVKGPAA